MRQHIREEDMQRFAEIGDVAPELWQQVERWYAKVFAPGALTEREKALVALAVAHAVHCPYCIETYTQEALEKDIDLAQMSEAVNIAAAVHAGGTLMHSVQLQRTRRVKAT